jgi:hypothetical protein
MTNKTTMINNKYEELAAKCSARKQQSLAIIRQACQAQTAKIKPNFSTAEIGRESEKLGGVSAQSIRTEPKQIYQALIDEFKRLYRVAEEVKVPTTQEEIERQIESIENNSLRYAMMEIYAKNKALVNENKQLKNLETLVYSYQTGELLSHQDQSGAGLDEIEIKALADFISSNNLKERGWSLTSQGQLLDENGKALSKRGFGDAIEKLTTLDVETFHKVIEGDV